MDPNRLDDVQRIRLTPYFLYLLRHLGSYVGGRRDDDYDGDAVESAAGEKFWIEESALAREEHTRRARIAISNGETTWGRVPPVSICTHTLFGPYICSPEEKIIVAATRKRLQISDRYAQTAKFRLRIYNMWQADTALLELIRVCGITVIHSINGIYDCAEFHTDDWNTEQLPYDFYGMMLSRRPHRRLAKLNPIWWLKTFGLQSRETREALESICRDLPRNAIKACIVCISLFALYETKKMLTLDADLVHLEDAVVQVKTHAACLPATVLAELEKTRLKESHCIICCETPPDKIFYPCGHVLMCESCYENPELPPKWKKVCSLCKCDVARVEDWSRIHDSLVAPPERGIYFPFLKY